MLNRGLSTDQCGAISPWTVRKRGDGHDQACCDIGMGCARGLTCADDCCVPVTTVRGSAGLECCNFWQMQDACFGDDVDCENDMCFSPGMLLDLLRRRGKLRAEDLARPRFAPVMFRSSFSGSALSIPSMLVSTSACASFIPVRELMFLELPPLSREMCFAISFSGAIMFSTTSLVGCSGTLGSSESEASTECPPSVVKNPSPDVPIIRSGANATCAIDASGELQCWGSEASSPPKGEFSALSMSSKTQCAVTVQGTVECWPFALEFPCHHYVDIFRGFDGRTCALTDSQELVCVDNNTSEVIELIDPSGRFVALDSSFGGCGVTTEGGAICWEFAGDGASPPSGPGIVQLASQWGGSCARYADGHVECSGELAQPDSESRFIDISVAYTEACGVRTDGILECWSPDADGGFGLRRLWNPDLPPEGEFIRFSLGNGFACGVKADFSVECWGKEENSSGHPTDLN